MTPEAPRTAVVARRGLFLKYVVVLVVLVSGALLASGGIEVWFSYEENKASLLAVQNEKAIGAAARIEAFVREIERQMGWTTQPQLVAPSAALEQRRIDFLRLLRQVPAITELSHLDGSGKEQLRVSRLAMDVVGSQTDFSREPKFAEARARTWFGPVYFRKESEPYMTIAMPVSGGAGVTVAEVNLKFIWDVVSQIKVGKSGRAFVVDGHGNLVAHPDISLVLQKTSLARLPQVQAALAGTTPEAARPTAVDVQGREVLAAHSMIMPLRWAVFVEQPIEEALVPLRASITRTVVLIFLGVAVSLVASVLLARRMVRPIRTLQEGAARIGAGELGHRLDVRTGDELQALAGQFNEMTGRLQESYATLERRVEERTRELSEALEQQTATSEILRVISGSPTDIQPVLDAVAESAARVCGAADAIIGRVDGDMFQRVAHFGVITSVSARRPITRDTPTGHAIVDRRTIHIDDIVAEIARGEYVEARPLQEATGFRTVLVVPLMREDTVIGAITIRRIEVQPFTAKQIALLKTFADQAVIAIENVRLFTELQEKNRAITEALEQQTATAEILRVISSSPTDVQPVFEAIARNAARLCNAVYGQVFRVEGGYIDLVAHHNFPVEGLENLHRRYPAPLDADTGSAQSARERRTVQLVDVEHLVGVPEERRELARICGYRSQIFVPMLRDDACLGVITVTRPEPEPFPEQQVSLLRTFADQAVIAIENVRLFTELQEKNRQVTEALEQQTATSEILGVISSSPTNIQPVFAAILENACRLCHANIAVLFLYDGEALSAAAQHGTTPDFAEHLARIRPRPSHETTTRLAALEQRVVHVTDLLNDPDFAPRPLDLYRRENVRTVVSIPMLRERGLVGVITLWRREVRPFTDKQIALVQTFADQAVIAIENVRLFTELQERTHELARSVQELQALSDVSRAVTSTLDVEATLQTIVTRAGELAGADGCSIWRYDADVETFVLRATHGPSGELLDTRGMTTLRRGEGVVGRLADTRAPIQVADITLEAAYQSPLRDTLVKGGFRALLAVPLIRENRVVGGLIVNRKTPGEFPPLTVELLQRFATQSSLALWNASLYREIEDKGRQLEIANRHKSEFLANMSHELRTPLNAVIGFSEVLLEKMFGEINDKQEEYLRDIYSSGRHLLSLINDILDLAKIEAGRMELEVTVFDLPQAIQNATTLVRGRADAHAIRLDVEIDRRLGDFAGDERKVKQILLNLLSNAVKFTPEGGRVTLRAGLANGSAEISVIDTGIGIAPEDQPLVFEEFRQVGADYARKREGTGLGLALTKRFVELHGGTIWLKSEAGEGSTFTFTLPVRPWPTSSS